MVKLNKLDDYDLIDDIAYEWECRTGMNLEFELFKKIYQKDVNNYLIVDMEGKVKSKGAYVKKLNDLDYDLAIVNKAIVDFMVKGVSVERTIRECSDFRMFQKVVKVSSKYLYGLKDATFDIKGSKKIWTGDGEKLNDKTFRVFASTRSNDGGIYKLKNLESNPEAFANTPEKCFIDNEDVTQKDIPQYLDRQWYIKIAKERLEQFGVI